MLRLSPPAVALFFLLACSAGAQEFQAIPRRLPPQGDALQEADRQVLAARVKKVRARCSQLADHPLLPDAEVLVKAVELALRHGEFYEPRDAGRATYALDLAEKRLAALENGESPWASETGSIMLAYRSKIDGSPQPYGLEIPAEIDREKSAPLYIWLHGRGDKNTDMNFIYDRLTRSGPIKPGRGAIVVHPFGRHCVGFKSAGEIDVLEAVADVQKRFAIDPERIVLMGFSMGGAGCWHLGAHYPDHWVAMSPGAGFAETAEYTNLKPVDYPPIYEQKLWGLYDAPDYVRNLFNLPVIAYSGENDRQIQAARVMESAFAEQGEKLTHLIGPGMGHRYHPDTLAEILRRVDQEVAKGLDRYPRRVHLQTKTLRYPQVHWVEAIALHEHWQDSRIDAELEENGTVVLRTKNIDALRLTLPAKLCQGEVNIDGQKLTATRNEQGAMVLVKNGDGWESIAGEYQPNHLHKLAGLQGPIDDVFYAPFLVVAPTGKSSVKGVDAWVNFELKHLQDRWRALFRGELPLKNDVDVTPEDIASRHLIVWGDPESNRLLARLQDQLPIRFEKDQVTVGEQKFARANHLPAFIYPNPLNLKKYLVVNSGMTFREEHDRTNSLQNPKLPDWAIIDFSTPPTGAAPGRIASADFFDERWQLRTNE